MTPAWVFMILVVPFGVVSGFLTVALAYQMHQAGADAAAIGTLIALSYLPHTWKFLWAPVIDLTWSRRGWYVLSTLATAASLVAMGMLAQDLDHLGALTAIVLLANLLSTFVGMAVESLMAHCVLDSHKGRVGGWFQAGNLGGTGVGGGLALWLMQNRGFTAGQAGIVLGILCALCCVALLRFREPAREARPATHLAGHLRHLWTDLWSVARSRFGFLAIAVCFLPIGSGAASNLWAAVAGDWQASADTVALVNGVLGGIIMAGGCLVGGRLCDRIDRKTAYCLFGLVQLMLAVGMSIAPRTEAAFVLFACAYAFAVGLTYAGFTAVVLEAIGRGAAATKYNLLASLSNMPVAYVTYVDGWAHQQWGATAMLQVEAMLGLAGLALFIAIAALSHARTVARR